MDRWKRWVLVGLAFLALAAILVHRILTDPQWRAFDTHTFLATLVSVNKPWILWALVSIYATYLVRALRWKVLMREMKPHPRLWNLFSATVIGFAAIGIFGRAGEMVRPYLVARKEHVPVSGQVAVWVIERAFDTMTIAVTVAFALGSFDPAALRESPSLARAIHIGGNVVASTMLAMLILMFAVRNFAAPITDQLLRRLHFLSPPRYAKLERNLRAFLQGSRALHSLSILTACTLYTMVEWALIAFCYSSVFHAFGPDLELGITDVLILMGGVMAGSLIQIPAVGGGIQVASLLVLTEIFGVRPEVAASMSLLIWVFTFLVVVPPAVVLALHEGLSWKNLRTLSSETELK